MSHRGCGFARAAASAARLPQPANAVFNRLERTEEQQPYWQAVEASLREVVWDRSHGVRQRVDPSRLEQLKQAAAAFRATLSAQQRSKIQGDRPYRRTGR